MLRAPTFLLSPAPRRLGRLHALVFLFLVGCLWSWGQAQVTSLPGATDELAHAIAVIEAEHALGETAARLEGPAACIKPLSIQSSSADLVCAETSDQEALPQWLVWVLPQNARPRFTARPALQQADGPPLLRPPIRLA